jgi:uncharacterized protein
MTKYASPSESVRIRAAFDSIPLQLAKENKKFHYKLMKKGASVSHFGVAVDWLSASGMVQKCYRIEHGTIPVSAYMDLSAFTLYLSDTGLLVQKAGLFPQTVMALQGNFKGALIENAVAQGLTSGGHALYYWESRSAAEMDFVITIKGYFIPVEVKSSDHIRSRSLSVYMNSYNPPYAIRISTKTSASRIT